MQNTPCISCYLIGQDTLLIECAKILLSKSFTIKGVIAPPDHIKDWASGQQINCFRSLSDIDWTADSADYLFSVGNDEIIPDQVLQLNRVLVINYREAPLLSMKCMEQTIASFAALVDGLVSHSSQRIPQDRISHPPSFPLLSEQLFYGPHQSAGGLDWNATETPYPAQKTIHGLFEEQADKTPRHLAVIADDGQLTYQQLNNRANQLAHYLQAHHDTRPDQLIAVCLERGQWLLPALLGVLKAGAAYLPLDPDYPAKRIEYVLNDTKTRTLITTQKQAEQLQHLPHVDWEKITFLVLDHSDVITALARQPQTNCLTVTNSRHLAYVMYTSGTTGSPKGICIEHRSIVNQISWMNKQYPLRATDRVLQKTSYAFDVSLWELFWPVWYGATIVFAKPEGHKDPAYLSQLIEQHQISFIHFTPSMLNAFVQALAHQNHQLASLREIFSSGEALGISTVHQTQALLPKVAIHNLYGPTETSIAVLAYDCVDPQAVYLGKPIANMRAYVLDTEYSLVPVGAGGELYVAGDGLARGYLNQLELTSQQFIANPFQTDQDKQAGRYDRLYKTGDWARWLPNGNLDYLGRHDRQVKLRGYRIELNEIEQVLKEYPEVHQNVVIVNDNHLIAYYVADEPLNVINMQKHMGTYLPTYMVPNQFVFLRELPLNFNGKIDHKKLPSPDFSSNQTYPLAQPSNHNQTKVAAIFVEVLGLEQSKVSITDDFFHLGGDSILAIRLVSRMNALFQQKIQVNDVFQLKTIQALSALLENQEAVALQSETRYVLFSLLSASARQHYQSLIDQVDDIYPASRLQVGMLLESSLNHYGTYHEVFHYQINLSFQEEKFLSVWDALTRKHALLRARFLMDDHHVLNAIIFKKPQIDYKLYIDQPLQQLMDRERVHPYTPAKASLFRLIVNQHTNYFDLIFSFHHALADGWSIASLINEFVQAYAHDLPIQVDPHPRLSYGEFVRNELHHIQDQTGIAFWKTYLADSEPVHAKWKWNDTTTSPDGLFKSAFFLTKEETELTHQVAREHAISVDVIFLYAYLKTLAFFFNQDDISIGVVLHNRLEKTGGDHLLGLFLNVVPFRLQLSEHTNLQESLLAAFTAKIKLHAHRHMPYSHLKSIFNRDLYQVGFNFMHFHVLNQSKPFINCQGSFDRNSIPFMLDVIQDDQFKVELKVHDGDISQQYLNYFMHYFNIMLHNILQNKNELVLDAPDVKRMLTDWNATQQTFPGQKTIHQLIEEQVTKTPDAIAVIDENEHLTYRELNSKANQLGHYLISQHAVEPDQLIAVYLERSPPMLIALLGILKAGAAYVPIDLQYPANRIAYLLRDTRSRIIITTQKQIERLCSVQDVNWQFITVLVIDEPEMQSKLTQQPSTNPCTSVTSKDLAYVMYTSGTTGHPKGIQIEHQGIVNQLSWMNRTYPLNPTDRVLQKTPYVFDVSVWELFWANCCGATVVFAQPEGHTDPHYLSRLIQEKKISIIQFTPSMLNEFVYALEHKKEQLVSLRQLFCIGEVLDAATVIRAQALLPQVEIHNTYGPTEASINVLAYDCHIQQPVLIGKPIDNTRAYVLDAQHRPVPVGAIGNLYFSGVGLARGYLYLPYLTEQKFLTNPFQTNQDQQSGAYGRIYQTGDLARWLPNGNLDFVGRQDRQVKLRGARVELGEIEQVLNHFPDIQQSVVTFNNNQLTAYYLSNHALDINRVRSHVAAYLPDYMVPAYFIYMESLPLTVNGKVDYKQLPEPDFLSDNGYIHPANETETKVAVVYAAVLGIAPEKISVTDDFFKVGGDSILAIRLVGRLNQLFNTTIYVKDVLALKTIRAVSDLLCVNEFAISKPEPPYSPYQPFSLIDKSLYENKLNFDQIEDIYPASYLQIGMLIESSLSDQGTYHDVFYYRIKQSFDQQKFLRIWEELAKKHPLLRARFLLSEQNALDVVIFKDAHLTYQFYIDQPLQQLIDTERLKHFSRTEDCLFHLIVNQHVDHFEFIFSFHHAIVDGWSIATLINEFVQAYCYDQAVSLTTAAQQEVLSYGEFVSNERRSLINQTSLQFWETYLADFEPSQAKWKFDDTETSPDSLFTTSFTLSEKQAQAVQLLAQNYAISIDCIFLYAYIKTLSFFLNSNDITIGLVFNNRLEKIGGDALIGLFLNVLPYRMQICPNKTLREELEETFHTKMRLYPHKHVPYAHLKSLLKQDLYQFGFNFVHFHVLNQSKDAIAERGGFDRTSVPFTLEVTQGVGFKVELKAHDNYISASYLHYFGSYFKTMLSNILQNKNEITLTDGDRHKLVAEWNASRQPFPHEKTLHQLFEEQAQRTPDAIALVFGDKQLTYHELNLRANQLAHYLVQRCQVKPDDLVVLCLDTDELVVISILAVMKSGGAYVPTAASYPPERMAHILNDTQSRIVLVNDIHKELIRPYAQRSSCAVITLDAPLLITELQHQPTYNPITPALSHHLAYALYTSGTTGKPNGVMIEHKSVVNLAVQIINKQRLYPNKHVALYSSFVFDASVHELFPALLSGCRVFMLPNHVRYDLQKLCEYFTSNAIQHSYIPTSLSSEFIRTCKSNTLDLIYSGGDRLSLGPHIDIDRLPYEFINEYGPTEATVGTTYKKVAKSKNGLVNNNNIGKPLANCLCYVCSANGRLVPIGAIGELLIGGDSPGRGYLNNPELTAKKFVSNPFQTDKEKMLGTNARLYKTGDLVRWLPHGDLEFIGRSDTQIKLSGHRIELGEIENVLMTFPEIKQAVVRPTLTQSHSTHNHLVAYYTKEANVQKNDERDFLGQWKDFYEYAYMQLDSKKYHENIQGWNSSYTSEPLTKVEMLEWRDEALSKIRQLNPQKILEVGSGSGLLLFNLLDQCQHYYATDISKNAIRYTQEVISKLEHPSRVTTIQCTADAIPYAELANNYDTVILNSVVQYFPNLDYLEDLLVQLIDHMQTGHIFIGDVRDYRLLNCFHHSLLAYKKMPCELIEVEYFSRREKELLISPAYFLGLKNRDSRISSIQLLPKVAKTDNEMTRYRYDIVLRIGDEQSSSKKIELTEFKPVWDLHTFMANQTQEYVCIKYRNQKVVPDYMNYQRTLDPQCNLLHENGDESCTIDQIEGIFDKYSYEVTFQLDPFDPLYLNLIAYRKGNPNKVEINYPNTVIYSSNSANNPLANIQSIEDKFHQQLQSHLRSYLPNYMIPNYFIALEKMPLTINGKLDHRALPKPTQPLTGNYFPPRSEIEKSLCHIFAQVLGIPEEKIGIKDDFFKIGGNSLLIFRLISKINLLFSSQLQPCHIFAYRNVENLSEFLTQSLH